MYRNVPRSTGGEADSARQRAGTNAAAQWSGVDASQATDRGREEASTWPSGRYAWYVVWVLTAAYALSFVDRQVVGLLLEGIRQDLELSDTQVSLLVGSAFAVFYVLFGVPLGRLADWTNRRNLIFAGICLWSLMTSACGFASGFGQLFAARIGVGIGEAALSPAALSIISDYFRPEQRARPLAMYFIALALGAGAAYFLGGSISAAVAKMPPVRLPVLGIAHAWRLVFIAVGLPGVLFAAMILTIREPTRRGVRTSRDTRTNGESLKMVSLRDALHFVWRESRQALAPIFIAYGGFSLFGDATLVWMPTVFVRRFGWDTGRIGLAMGLVILVCATIGILMGMTIVARRKRLEPAGALILTSLAMGLTLIPFGILLPLAPTPALALWLMGPAVALSFGLFPMGPAILQLITPNQLRGQVSGLFSLFVNVLGLMVGATSIALLTDYVFRDRMLLHYSLATVAAVVLPLSAWVMWQGLAHVEHSVGRAALWLTNEPSEGATDTS